MNKIVLLFANVGSLLLAISLAGAQALNDPGLEVRELVAGLIQSTTMAFIGSDDILVLQKTKALRHGL